ncbi:hypothetical protein [Xylella fastidiosa]|nr:hypothetical protein [Xylella fastidiosa]WCF18967.1 hypothetical protein OK118_08430 [Xylella fastidiosa subsp. fastidiosa]WCF21187.1 hypothetical protein OK114_08435 [Xylella fastidiosa subsp. fastidiosa]
MVICVKCRNGMPSRVGHGDTAIGCDGVVRVAMLLVGRAVVWEHRARGVLCLSFDLRCVSLKPQWAGFIKKTGMVYGIPEIICLVTGGVDQVPSGRPCHRS